MKQCVCCKKYLPRTTYFRHRQNINNGKACPKEKNNCTKCGKSSMSPSIFKRHKCDSMRVPMTKNEKAKKKAE